MTMHKHNFCVLVAKSTLLSLISCLMLSAYQSPSHADNQPSNTLTNRHDQFNTRTDKGSINHSPTLSRKYTSAQINYFLEVALGSEFGNQVTTIKKWNKDVKIKVVGSPTAEDLNTLNTVIDDINTLTNGSIRLQIASLPGRNKPQGYTASTRSTVANNANVELYFVPVSQFGRYEPNYQPVNYGFFWDLWNNNVIYKSRVLISTVGITQKERSHLIREELTQSLGLMQDSYKYKESIFYQGWTDPTDYAEIDKALIEMLYRPEIRPGMTKSQVLKVFRELEAKAESRPQCEPSDANPALDFSVAPYCETR